MFTLSRIDSSFGPSPKKIKCIVFIAGMLALNYNARCQEPVRGVQPASKKIYTAFPFLLINPDARTGGMGDVGVSLPDDRNSMADNPSKMIFLEERNGFSLSYSPYLKSLANGISLAYLSGYFRLSDNKSLGASLKYLSFGRVEITSAEMQRLGSFNPSEAAFDISYAQSFGENFSMALAMRYVTSGGRYSLASSNTSDRESSGIGADVSAFFKCESNLFGEEGLFSMGLNITNIGPKIRYSEIAKEFLPTNLRLGGTFLIPVQELNRVIFSIEINKLMVPSGSALGTLDPDVRSNTESVPGAILSSFTDAPGGFSEELSELSIASGIEFSFNKVLALRGGYFYESPQKGFRRYFTLGTGLRIKNIDLDLAYIAASPQNNPLANTLRFSLGLKI